jgi:SAM-dependent methyltransferase
VIVPDELPGFQTEGLSWQERAEQCGGDCAVYAPDDPRLSRWLALVHGECLREALNLLRPDAVVVDFGCGTGEKTAVLAARAGQVVALDITPGMLQRARDRCAGLNVLVGRIDGVHLPLHDASIDVVWISSVLRYSLLVPEPRHREIVDELHRVLRPGGYVCNVEMYVREGASTFAADFRARGFEILEQRPVHVFRSRPDRLALGRWHRVFLRRFWARLSVAWTRRRMTEDQLGRSLRDYFFIYRRPL